MSKTDKINAYAAFDIISLRENVNFEPRRFVANIQERKVSI